MRCSFAERSAASWRGESRSQGSRRFGFLRSRFAETSTPSSSYLSTSAAGTRHARSFSTRCAHHASHGSNSVYARGCTHGTPSRGWTDANVDLYG